VNLTLAELRKRVGNDEEQAYLLMEELRWPDGPECSHCGHDKAYFLTPKNPEGRRSGPATKRTVRRVWKCAKCRKQFSVLTGTIFHGTKVKLADWLTVLVLMSSSKNGIASREVERLIDVTPETAWFMLHRIREAMRRDDPTMFSGVVIADETFMGGKFKNMHKSQQKHYTAGRAGGPYDKTPVLSLIDADTGQIRSRVLPRVDGSNLRKAIAEQVDLPNTILHTDKSASYNVVAKETAGHFTVDHKADEYVRHEAHGIVTTNRLEGYFSQLKRSIDGTFHHVSVEHLQRYLDEFDFRYSTRTLKDSARLQRIIDQVAGRRLTYKRAVAH
jgi:transposase-like protein